MGFSRGVFVDLHDGTNLDDVFQWLEADAQVPDAQATGAQGPGALKVAVAPASEPDAAEPEPGGGSAVSQEPVLLTGPVSLDLVAVLAEQVPADATDVDLVDGLGAWQRSMGFASSRMFVQMAELYARRVGPSLQRLAAAQAVRAQGGAGGRRSTSWAQQDVNLDVGAVENEIALALSWSRGRATRALAVAVTLTSRMTQTLDALASGEVEARKAEVMATDVGNALTDDDLVARVEAQVLPEAAKLTIPALRELIKSTILRLAPDLAAERAFAARARRGVSFFPEPDDMMRVEALMGAGEGMAFITALDKVTHVAKAEGDPRSAGEVRVDTMVDAVVQAAEDILDAALDTLDNTDANTGNTHAKTGDSMGEAGVSVEDEIAEADARPAGQAGDQPDDQAGDQAGDRPDEGADSPASEGAGGAGAASSPPGQHQQPDPPGPVDPHRGPRMPSKEHARRRARIRRALKHEVNVTVPLETITGQADHPGYLARYGPITAVLAREMALDAAREGYWRCVVTDDVHGTVLGMGKSTFTPAYEAPVSLQRFLNLRDRVCDFPGCRQAAVLCEFDHHVPHPAGATCECNGKKRCQHHHRLKHETAWRVESSQDPDDPPGTSVWTTPAGKTYVNRPPVVGVPTTGVPSPGVPAPGTNPDDPPSSDSGRRWYRDSWARLSTQPADHAGSGRPDPGPPPF